MSGADRLDGPRPWSCVASREGPDFKIFRARLHDMVNPRNGRHFERVVLETPDWVNVLALTPERELVVIRQYRFGAAAVTTEIPGGIVDDGESPESAARRELAEETGYTGGTWHSLGHCEPNPAFQTNRCYHWLARDVIRTADPVQDSGEDITVGTLPLEAVKAAVASGEIRHALILSALFRILDLRGPFAQDGNANPT